MTWAREPGSGPYARPERERRFLVRADPPELQDTRTVEDRYLDGTRLRLRHVHAGGRSVWKLTQQVRVDQGDPAVVRLTNAYGPEVTHDDRFSGGRLAGLDEPSAAGLLDEVRRRTA